MQVPDRNQVSCMGGWVNLWVPEQDIAHTSRPFRLRPRVSEHEHLTHTLI